jgi:putative transposase
MSKNYPVFKLCQIAEVSRAGYYKWLMWLSNAQSLRQIPMAIQRVRPYFGYYRMRTALRKEGLIVNHKKVRRLMREMGIQSVIRKKRLFAGRKPSVVFDNVLNRCFTAQSAMEKYVTDITYIRTGFDFVYLSVVMDLHNNEVVAWLVLTMRASNRSSPTLKPVRRCSLLIISSITTMNVFRKNSATDPRWNSEKRSPLKNIVYLTGL